MADERTQRIIEANRYLLLKNIVPSKETYDAFAESRTLPKFVVDNILQLDGQNVRNEKLLEGVEQRKVTIDELCDVLQTTGHNLLAEHLRNEALERDTLFTKDDLLQRFPRLDKLLPSRREKERVLCYLMEKFKEEVARARWKNDNSSLEKEKTLLAKQQQIDDRLKYKRLLRERDDVIQQMTTYVHEALNEAETSGTTLRETTSTLAEMKTGREAVLRVQMQYAQALDNTLIRQNSRQQEHEAIAKKMMEVIGGYLPTDFVTGVNASSDLDITVFRQALTTLMQFCEYVKTLRKTEDYYEDLKEDVVLALKIMGEAEGSNIIDATRRVLKRVRDKEKTLGVQIATLAAKQSVNKNRNTELSATASEGKQRSTVGKKAIVPAARKGNSQSSVDAKRKVTDSPATSKKLPAIRASENNPQVATLSKALVVSTGHKSVSRASTEVSDELASSVSTESQAHTKVPTKDKTRKRQVKTNKKTDKVSQTDVTNTPVIASSGKKQRSLPHILGRATPVRKAKEFKLYGSDKKTIPSDVDGDNYHR